MKYVTGILIVFVISACSLSKVTKREDGVLVIAKSSRECGFRPASILKGEAAQEANEYCAKNDLFSETIRVIDTGSNSAAPNCVNIFHEFRCVN